MEISIIDSFSYNTYQSAEELLVMCFRTLDVSNPSQEMR
jgi:hypothetical protein